MTRRMRSVLTGFALVAALLLQGAAVSAQASVVEGNTGILNCYDSAHSYSKPAGSYYFPPGAGYLTTTSNCGDISIRPNTNRYVRVCFLPSSEPSYCQDNYTLAYGGEWNVIAFYVGDGTAFWFDFRSSALSNGRWAA